MLDEKSLDRQILSVCDDWIEYAKDHGLSKEESLRIVINSLVESMQWAARYLGHVRRITDAGSKPQH